MSGNQPMIAHGLETPYPLQPFQNYFRLEGWALIRPGDQPTRVRVRIDDKIYLPESTPARADVAQRYPNDAYADRAGFVFVVFLPFGNYLGTLEASNDDGQHWHRVKTLVIPVSSHPLVGDFEPVETESPVTQTYRPRGWVWHPEFEIAEVVLLFGDKSLAVDRGLERPDVADRFPNQTGARLSGFIARENLPRGQGAIRLQITTTCGRVYFLASGVTAKITDGAYAPDRPVPDMWSLSPPASASTSIAADPPATPGDNNILFVLYGDFTSNSAHHVAAFANELISRGYDCIVAVPEHPETIGAVSYPRFLAIEFPDLANLPSYFRDGRPPAVVHAWTTRERVRLFCQDVQRQFGSELIVHLEDNERELLAAHLGCSLDALQSMTDEQLTVAVPLELTHPIRAREFLASSRGVTTIVDRLGEFVPAPVPHTTLWPAAHGAFSPRPLNHELRQRLGIAVDDIVLFYHGNIHPANQREMTELYLAVDQLNQAGHPTWLVRTGRDDPSFNITLSPETQQRILHLGFVKRNKDLPVLLSIANYFVQPGTAGAFNDYRFPSKLPEFFALGRPVILPASNLGNELEPGRDAFVLPVADAPAITAAILTLQSDPDLAQRLAAGAVAFSASRFSWARSSTALIEFYHQTTRLKFPDQAHRDAAAVVAGAFAASEIA